MLRVGRYNCPGQSSARIQHHAHQPLDFVAKPLAKSIEDCLSPARFMKS